MCLEFVWSLLRNKGRFYEKRNCSGGWLLWIDKFTLGLIDPRAIRVSWRHADVIKWKRTLLVLCTGNSPVTGEFPAQRPVMRSFDVSYDLRLDKGLSKQSWGWWFETPSRSLWRYYNSGWGRNCSMFRTSTAKYITAARLQVDRNIHRCHIVYRQNKDSHFL